jgi:sodium transport system permease protein
MAVILTRRPLKSLLITRPSFLATVPAAMLLAAMLHPAMMVVSQMIQQLYPISEETLKLLQPLNALMLDAPLWQVVLLIGLVPAICEELAFRGFILSGLRHIGHKWTAIVLTAAFFGAVHGILQQSISAFVVGIVLGYIAVKTGSILPAVAYHFTHNSLSVVTQRIGDSLLNDQLALRLMLERSSETGSVSYSLTYTIIAGLLGVAILFWFKSLPYEATREEAIEELRDRQIAPLAVKLAR